MPLVKMSNKQEIAVKIEDKIAPLVSVTTANTGIKCNRRVNSLFSELNLI